MLHIINKSPFERDSLDSCLRLASDGSSVLFIEDGVYAALNNTSASSKVQAAMERVSFYVLDADLETRGVAGKLMDGIKQVGYDDFVDLVAESDKVQSWL